jgi:hypothetical protein
MRARPRPPPPRGALREERQHGVRGVAEQADLYYKLEKYSIE